MDAVNIHQAETNFSRLLARVELGEEIMISNQGTPVPFRAVTDRRSSLGRDIKLFTVPDNFDAPLPDDVLADFEGSAL